MWLMLKEVVRHHGIPESIVSYRDTKFTSIFQKELHRWIGSKFLMSTTFHPQTDGVMERANRSIAEILWTVVTNDQKDWSSKCPMMEFAINSSVNATTGYAPFKLNYGYMLWSGQHIFTDTTFKGVKQFAQQAAWNVLDAHDAILEHTVTPKTLSILTPNVVWRVHRLTAQKFCLALVELYIVHTLGYKIAPWVMWFGPQGVEIWSI